MPQCMMVLFAISHSRLQVHSGNALCIYPHSLGAWVCPVSNQTFTLISTLASSNHNISLKEASESSIIKCNMVLFKRFVFIVRKCMFCWHVFMCKSPWWWEEGVGFPWDWSYRRLWATMWMPGTNQPALLRDLSSFINAIYFSLQ